MQCGVGEVFCLITDIKLCFACGVLSYEDTVLKGTVLCNPHAEWQRGSKFLLTQNYLFR